MSQHCDICKRVMRFEYHIDDKIWRLLDKKYQTKVLCIECFLYYLSNSAPELEMTLDDFDFISIIDPLHDENDCMKSLHPKFGGILIDST